MKNTKVYGKFWMVVKSEGIYYVSGYLEESDQLIAEFLWYSDALIYCYAMMSMVEKTPDNKN